MAIDDKAETMTLKVLFGGKKRPRRRGEPAEPARWRKHIPEARDVFLFGGIAAAGYGVYQIYPPSAFVLVGGFFIAMGILMYLGGDKPDGN